MNKQYYIPFTFCFFKIVVAAIDMSQLIHIAKHETDMRETHQHYNNNKPVTKKTKGFAWFYQPGISALK